MFIFTDQKYLNFKMLLFTQIKWNKIKFCIIAYRYKGKNKEVVDGVWKDSEDDGKKVNLNKSKFLRQADGGIIIS